MLNRAEHTGFLVHGGALGQEQPLPSGMSTPASPQQRKPSSTTRVEPAGGLVPSSRRRQWEEPSTYSCFTPWSGGVECARLLLTGEQRLELKPWSERGKMSVSWTSLQRESLRRMQLVRWNCHSCLLEMFNELGIQLRKCSTAGSSKIKIIIIVRKETFLMY